MPSSTGAAIRAGQAYIELFADKTKLDKNLTEAQYAVKKFAQTVNTSAMQAAAGAAVTALPVFNMSKAYAEFDDKMRLVKAVTQSTGSAFDALKTKALDLGKTTSFTSKQAAEAMVSLGRMGFKNDQINASITSVLNLARATGSDLPTAAEIAAGAMYAFKLQAKDISGVADVLTSATNSSAMTLNDMALAFKHIGPVSAAFGENIASVSAALGVLANSGVKAETAATSLRAIMTRMAMPSVLKEYSRLGVRIFDAAGNRRALSDILADYKQALDKLSEAERAISIYKTGGMRAGATMETLLKSSEIKDGTTELKKLEDQLAHSRGEAARIAEEMDRGLGGMGRRFYSAMEYVTLGVGQANECFQGLGESLVSIVRKFGDLTRSYPSVVQAFTAVSGAVAGVAAAAAMMKISLIAGGGILGSVNFMKSMGQGMYGYGMGLFQDPTSKRTGGRAVLGANLSRIFNPVHGVKWTGWRGLWGNTKSVLWNLNPIEKARMMSEMFGNGLVRDEAVASYDENGAPVTYGQVRDREARGSIQNEIKGELARFARATQASGPTAQDRMVLANNIQSIIASKAGKSYVSRFSADELLTDTNLDRETRQAIAGSAFGGMTAQKQYQSEIDAERKAKAKAKTESEKARDAIEETLKKRVADFQKKQNAWNSKAPAAAQAQSDYTTLQNDETARQAQIAAKQAEIAATKSRIETAKDTETFWKNNRQYAKDLDAHGIESLKKKQLGEINATKKEIADMTAAREAARIAEKLAADEAKSGKAVEKLTAQSTITRARNVIQKELEVIKSRMRVTQNGGAATLSESERGAITRNLGASALVPIHPSEMQSVADRKAGLETVMAAIDTSKRTTEQKLLVDQLTNAQKINEQIKMGAKTQSETIADTIAQKQQELRELQRKHQEELATKRTEQSRARETDSQSAAAARNTFYTESKNLKAQQAAEKTLQEESKAAQKEMDARKKVIDAHAQRGAELTAQEEQLKRFAAAQKFIDRFKKTGEMRMSDAEKALFPKTGARLTDTDVYAAYQRDARALNIDVPAVTSKALRNEYLASQRSSGLAEIQRGLQIFARAQSEGKTKSAEIAAKHVVENAVRFTAANGGSTGGNKMLNNILGSPTAVADAATRLGISLDNLTNRDLQRLTTEIQNTTNAVNQTKTAHAAYVADMKKNAMNATVNKVVSGTMTGLQKFVRGVLGCCTGMIQMAVAGAALAAVWKVGKTVWEWWNKSAIDAQKELQRATEAQKKLNDTIGKLNGLNIDRDNPDKTYSRKQLEYFNDEFTKIRSQFSSFSASVDYATGKVVGFGDAMTALEERKLIEEGKIVESKKTSLKNKVVGYGGDTVRFNVDTGNFERNKFIKDHKRREEVGRDYEYVPVARSEVEALASSNKKYMDFLNEVDEYNALNKQYRDNIETAATQRRQNQAADLIARDAVYLGLSDTVMEMMNALTQGGDLADVIKKSTEEELKAYVAQIQKAIAHFEEQSKTAKGDDAENIKTALGNLRAALNSVNDQITQNLIDEVSKYDESLKETAAKKVDENNKENIRDWEDIIRDREKGLKKAKENGGKFDGKTAEEYQKDIDNANLQMKIINATRDLDVRKQELRALLERAKNDSKKDTEKGKETIALLEKRINETDTEWWDAVNDVTKKHRWEIEDRNEAESDRKKREAEEKAEQEKQKKEQEAEERRRFKPLKMSLDYDKWMEQNAAQTALDVFHSLKKPNENAVFGSGAFAPFVHTPMNWKGFGWDGKNVVDTVARVLSPFADEIQKTEETLALMNPKTREAALEEKRKAAKKADADAFQAAKDYKDLFLEIAGDDRIISFDEKKAAEKSGDFSKLERLREEMEELLRAAAEKRADLRQSIDLEGKIQQASIKTWGGFASNDRYVGQARGFENSVLKEFQQTRKTLDKLLDESKKIVKIKAE